MDVGAPLVANDEATKAMQPRKAAFDDPSESAEFFARLDAATSDARHDATQLARRTRRARIVRLVRMQLVRTPPPSALGRRNGGHTVPPRPAVVCAPDPLPPPPNHP